MVKQQQTLAETRYSSTVDYYTPLPTCAPNNLRVNVKQHASASSPFHLSVMSFERRKKTSSEGFAKGGGVREGGVGVLSDSGRWRRRGSLGAAICRGMERFQTFDFRRTDREVL